MLGPMKTTINLEENIGKWVGRREPRGTIEEQYRRLLRMGRSLNGGTHLPRGVTCFKSFEEADQWNWNQIMKRARKLIPANLNSTTSPASAQS